MEQFKGTPGPWSGKDVGICKQDRAGLQLGFIMTTDEDRVVECAANAHLIAAAPDLLESLQALVKVIDAAGWEAATVDARAAIAKALGKE